MNSNKTGEDLDNLPRHVAIIMDGNGRWAQKRRADRINGHEKGKYTVKAIIKCTLKMGIPYLTLYAFSTENWRRPKAEVMGLMLLLKDFLITEREEMIEDGVRLNAIGELDQLPRDVRDALAEATKVTAKNSRLVLTLCLSYGGREELTQCVKAIAEKVQNHQLSPEDITEEILTRHLYTHNIPDPDLMIRTSGEMRTSNFLPWQLAYAELFFTPTLWPDFSRNEYFAILGEFAARERRFGKTGDQIKA